MKDMLSAQRKIDLQSGRIGLISDTHGLMRPQALAALKRSEIILHAGDIGEPEVLDALRTVAPVVAIRGNNDRGSWTRGIPQRIDLTVNGFKLHLIHDLNDLRGEPAYGFDAVISGHSHQPRSAIRDGVLFINPGSAGPRRFKLPVAVGRLRIQGGKIHGMIIRLQV